MSEGVSVGIAGQSTQRVASIDIFRGLTMAVMIFVNELSDVKGLPWWTYHAHGYENRMTYVDMVFPFFLFIVGLAMPIAVRARLRRDASEPRLWGHVMLRAAGLLALGLILANADRSASNPGVWALLALGGAALWLRVGGPGWLRWVGLALVAVMFAVFRRAGGGWIDPRYPEILGLIGFTYFAVSVLYLPTRRLRWAPVGWLAAMTGFCVLWFGGRVPLLRHAPWWVWPWDNGSLALLVFAGIATSVIFVERHRWSRTPGQRLGVGVVFGVLLLLAAWALAPWGISKIRGTPTWALASAGAAVLCFAALYWVADVKGHTRWAAPVRAAGANALLTYLLPDAVFFALLATHTTALDTHWSYGWPGVVKTLAFTAVMLGLATLLTRARVRLAL